MDMILYSIIGTIPVLLIILAGLLILRASPGEAGERRFLFWLLGAETILLLIVFIYGLLSSQNGYVGTTLFTTLLTPCLIGILALALTKINVIMRQRAGIKALALILGLGDIAISAALWFQPAGYTQLILPGALLLAVSWVLTNKSDLGAILLGLAALGYLALIHSGVSGWMMVQQVPAWAKWIVSALLYIFPCWVVVAMGILVLKSTSRFATPGLGERPKRASLAVGVLELLLAGTILAYLSFTIYWESIWDQTSDGLSGVWITFQVILAAVGTGIFLGVSVRRLIAPVFTALVLLVVFTTSKPEWGIYHSINDQRVSRIQAALERFHSRNGTYPAALQDLRPRDMLWVPNPVIFRGEGWCYQGNTDSYRLGAVYREYFSSSISIRIYASAGTPTSQGWSCDQRLAEILARYKPIFPEESVVLPTAEPLPTSDVSIQKMAIQPVVKSRSIDLGSWSPDGQYLAYALPKVEGGKRLYTLGFLNARTGLVCQTEEEYPGSDEIPRQSSAWLPDGRLLYFTGAELLLISPCHAKAELITQHYPPVLGLLSPYNQSGRILIKGKSSYWILDPYTLEAKEIPEVSPNPFDLHWDNAAWSPNDDQVAISRLNGQNKKGGSTLFIVDVATAKVQYSLPLTDASDQSAPWVEWLTNDQILLHGTGTLWLIDLRTSPPGMTNVFKELFKLNLSYPDEVSTTAAILDPSSVSYHLAVRLNHKKDDAVYLYHSETGKMEVLHSMNNQILIFPDSQWVEMRSMSDALSQDEYEVFWVDSPGTSPIQITVQGHQPRNYPNLDVRYIPNLSALAFASSQGVSLVSITDGKLLHFWDLVDRSTGLQPGLLAAPNGESLIANSNGDGLYYIPLSR